MTHLLARLAAGPLPMKVRTPEEIEEVNRHIAAGRILAEVPKPSKRKARPGRCLPTIVTAVLPAGMLILDL